MISPSEHRKKKPAILAKRTRWLLQDIDDEISKALSFPRHIEAFLGLDTYLQDSDVDEIVRQVRDEMLKSGWYFTIEWKRDYINHPRVYLTVDQQPFEGCLPSVPKGGLTETAQGGGLTEVSDYMVHVPKPAKLSWWQRIKKWFGIW